LLTGVSPGAGGWKDGGTSLPSDVQTLAQHFAGAGFDTAAFVLSPMMSLAGTGLERGFHAFAEEQQPLDLLRAVATWLFQGRDEERPHFLWLHIGEAAWPWEWTPLPGSRGALDFARLYTDPAYEGELRTDLDHLRAVQRGDVRVDPDERAALVAAYDAQISRANLVMREFLEYYKHIWSGTLVIVASLNGMELGERGDWGAEGSLHDEGLHVPLILRHPDSLTGRRVLGEVVELSDIAPTALDWFGIDAPAGTTGRSLLPLVDSYVRRPFERRPMVTWGVNGAFGVRDDRWRMLVRPEGTVELHDLYTDPRARRDVSVLYPEVVRSLREAAGPGHGP
jgi:arylsulfatase A-like enzyme